MGVLTIIKDSGTELLNAVRDNDLKTFKSICEKHLKHDKQIAQLCTMDIKHRPSRKYACPLILAARLEDASIIRYMMEVGTSPNFIHQSVYTTGKKDVVTPLHVAVDLNLIQTVDILLSFSADPNVPDHNDDTPFIIAVKKSNWMLMKMMLTKGGSPSITDRKGNAPLHMATIHGHLQMVKTLLKNNADLHQKGFQGAIPSHIAAREGHIHLVQVFCSADPALVNTKIPCFTDQREKALMHLSAERGHAETVIALIDQFNADVNLKDSRGNTPLHCVVLHYYRPDKMRDKDYFYGTAKILVKYKTSINEKNHDGRTALHLAAMNNHPRIVELLLSVGANAFAEDDGRMKPIDVVPDADTVSKQLLKTAMLNPKPPINASSLSLAQNSSFHVGTLGDFNGAKNSFITKSMLESSGSTTLMKAKNFSLDSSSMSVFANNVKQTNQSPRSIHKSHGPSKYQTNNKMPDLPQHHIRRHHHHHRRRRSLSSDSHLPSVFSGSSQDLYWRDHRYYSEASSDGDDDDTLSGRRPSSRRRHDRRKDESCSRRRKYSGDSRSLEKNYRDVDKIHRTDRSYAVARSGRTHVADRSLDRSGRKRRESDRRHVNRADVSESIYSDEDGVKVHKFPGKPKTIEVEYTSGPITIEFENQDQPLLQQFDHKIKQKDKKHKKNPDRVKRRDTDSSSKEIVNDWFSEMTKYNKNQKKKSNQMDEDEFEEDQTDEEISSPVTSKTPGFQRPSRGQLMKEKFKHMKQKQYEEQQEMEKLPIVDPEPPTEKLGVVDDDSFSDDSSFDSDSFKEKLNDTQRVLNDSASKNIFEVMQRVQSKWSQDESDNEEPINSKRQGRTIFDQKTLQPSLNEKDKNKSFESELNIGRQSNLIETLRDEVIKLETIAVNAAKQKHREDKEDNKESSNRPSDTESGSPKRGLNMRVSGETPKAYTRKGKNSARAKFILASPVKIESSSEASDSEQSFSSASLKRRTEWGRPLTPIQMPVKKTEMNGSINNKCLEQVANASHIKPYKSFGKIEVRTDALEGDYDDDESKTLETSFNTEASSDLSPILSKIIPEKYQIKKPSKETNLDDNFDETFQGEELQNKSLHLETERLKRPSKNLKLIIKGSGSFEDLLESYADEPNGRKPKNFDLPKAVQPINNESKGRPLKKKKIKSKMRLPEGLSPEVWEEASNTFPLASSDTYASVKKPVKVRSTKASKKGSLEQDLSQTQPNLDVCVPLLSDVSDQSQIFTDSSLSVNIPASNEMEDEKKLKKPFKNKQSKITVFEIQENTSISKEKVAEKEFRLKNQLLEVKDSSAGKSFKQIQSGRMKRPPKPSTSLHLRPLKVDEPKRISEQSVEDLNELPLLKKRGKFIPKYPNRPYDIYRIAAYSDTEMNADKSMRQNFNYIHSEAEASDFELPNDPRPGASYKQAALHSLNYKILEYRHKSLLLQQPGHHDKNFDYLRKLYRPRRRRPRVRSAHLLPTAGKYGDKEFRRVLSNQSFTESENEVDQNRSFISDDEFDDRYGSTQSLTSRQDKKISPIYESLMRYKRLKQMRLEFKQKESEPIGPLEPEGVRFEKYDDVARMWMEQVDRKTVLKSNTMYFKVLPHDRDLPNFLAMKDDFRPSHVKGGVLPQWVMARTRFIQTKSAKDPFANDTSFLEGSCIRRHLILFFKIGIDWMELAWVLFDGLSTESEVVRMIKDIQIKHPLTLSDQVEDLMWRWWHKKGDQATIQELQRALDLIQMFYIQEEIVNRGDETSTFMKYLENEDELDTGDVAGDDPNVSHLDQEYNSRSLNNSFISNSVRSTKHSEEFTSEKVMRKMQTAKTIQTGTNEILARVSRPPSRTQDLDRSTSTTFREDTDILSPGSFTKNKQVSDLYHLVSHRKKKQSKHETNL